MEILTIPKPPQHLSKKARAWWRQLQKEYDLKDATAQLLLESALSAFDRWQLARETLAREGTFVRDRFKQRQIHPGVAVERDAKNTMRAALRELHLDIEPLAARPGRQPGK